MKDTHDRTRKTSPGHPTARFRWRRWALVPVLVAGIGLAFVACGSSDSIATLDTKTIERAIAKSSFDQRGQRAEVSCPSTVLQKEGLKFSCTAVVGSTSTRFVVVQQDESGTVHYEAP
jgi:hypothetical protein